MTHRYLLVDFFHSQKDSKCRVENYQPKSILNVFGKCFEKAVYKEIYPVIKQGIPDEQHGFVEGRSTLTNLGLFVSDLHKNMVMQSQVDVIYTDIEKAFDRVDHVILLQKLYQLGIRGDLFRWIKSYISNRKQAVVIGGDRSEFVNIPSGVPQGSLLGPLFYSAYLNDIGSCFKHAKFLLYADDTKIYMKVKSNEDCLQLQKDLDRLSEYYVRNRIAVNETKCIHIQFIRRKNAIEYNFKLNNTSLCRATTVKDLGLYLDTKLTFEKHFEHIINKAHKNLGFIFRVTKEFSDITGELLKTDPAMQCNPPFISTGYPNYRPYHPCNFSYPHRTMYPEIIGEGEVASVIYPDGSVHFYFIPTNKRNTPFCDPNLHTHHPYWNNASGMFYVRSISNPMSSALFSQQCQNNNGLFSKPYMFGDTTMPFQLKFHNDGWSSTTDLHYFSPRLRQCEWRPTSITEYASAQTDTPAENPTVCQTVCAKPCNCSNNSNKNVIQPEREFVDECKCYQVHNKRSDASMSSGKDSNTKIRKKKTGFKYKKHKEQRSPVKITSNVECECREPCTTDKSVTTYTDQASNCNAEERKTQTSPSNCSTSCFTSGLERTVSKDDLKTELWFPKSLSRQNPADIKTSEKILGVFETDCSSASCCCSEADTDRHE
ncbi:hypothetical protein evm_001139 [Chilo suppressalis]|nr:hypothetical protein evm_001139 [Chilo suppressalis]